MSDSGEKRLLYNVGAAKVTAMVETDVTESEILWMYLEKLPSGLFSDTPNHLGWHNQKCCAVINWLHWLRRNVIGLV